MEKVVNFLSGKKTYLASIITPLLLLWKAIDPSAEVPTTEQIEAILTTGEAFIVAVGAVATILARALAKKPGFLVKE